MAQKGCGMTQKQLENICIVHGLDYTRFSYGFRVKFKAGYLCVEKEGNDWYLGATEMFRRSPRKIKSLRHFSELLNENRKISEIGGQFE